MTACTGPLKAVQNHAVFLNEEASRAANSIGMWLVCTPMVAIMLFQAYIFMIKTWESGTKMGLSRDQMKQGIRTAP